MKILESLNELISYNYGPEERDFQSIFDIDNTDDYINHPEIFFKEEQKDHIFYKLCLIQKFYNSSFIQDFNNFLENLNSDIEGDFEFVDKRSYILFYEKYKDMF